jgi:hypothetical protein
VMAIPTNTVTVKIVRSQIQICIDTEEAEIVIPLTSKEAMELADGLLQASTRLMTAKMVSSRKDGA